MNRTISWVCIAGAAFFTVACDKNNSLPDRNDDETPKVTDPDNRPMDEAHNEMGKNHMDRDDNDNLEATNRELTHAKATIQSVEGAKVTGEARFTEEAHGVKIVVDVQGAPAGEKGIHIHEKGDCSDIPGESMGSHFAPEHKNHGLPSPLKADLHLGDLGNIEIKDDGTGKKEITVDKANLRDGDSMSFLGKSLVIHQDEDKGASEQPSGGSGTPIACGVIKKETP